MEAASRVRTALETAPASALGAVADSVAEVIAACAELSAWLGASPAPRGLEDAHAELGAALGVLRNAAFAFRSIDEVEGEQREVRTRICASMLEQWEHHIEAFSALTRGDIMG